MLGDRALHLVKLQVLTSIVVLYLQQAFQIGPTELSRYFVYWVPSQYVEAIKDAILGKWQYF